MVEMEFILLESTIHLSQINCHLKTYHFHYSCQTVGLQELRFLCFTRWVFWFIHVYISGEKPSFHWPLLLLMLTHSTGGLRRATSSSPLH